MDDEGLDDLGFPDFLKDEPMSFYLTDFSTKVMQNISTMLAYGMALNAVKQDYLTATSVLPRAPTDPKIPAYPDVESYPDKMRVKYPLTEGELPNLAPEYRQFFLCVETDDNDEVTDAREAWTKFVLDLCDGSIDATIHPSSDMAAVFTFVKSVEGLSEFFKAFPWVCFLLYHPDGLDPLYQDSLSEDVKSRCAMENGELIPRGFRDPHKMWEENFRKRCVWLPPVSGSTKSVRRTPEAQKEKFDQLYSSGNFAEFVHQVDIMLSSVLSSTASEVYRFSYNVEVVNSVNKRTNKRIESTFNDYVNAR